MAGWKSRIIGYKDVRLDEILFNPRNWRIHPREQYEALARIMGSIGIVQNIVVNARLSATWPDGERGVETLVDGHCRAIEADKAGQETLPATVVDLLPEEERVIIASLDKVTVMAVPDNEQVSILLSEIIEDGNRAKIVGIYDDRQVETLIQAVAIFQTPEEFREFGASPVVDYRCPRCGYGWTGSPVS